MQGQWEQRYETLLKSQDIGDIYSIFASMSDEEMSWYRDKPARQQQSIAEESSARVLFSKINPLNLVKRAPKTTAEFVGAAAGAGFAASALAANTMVIFGIGITFATAPVAVVASSAVAGGLGMYGLFKTTGFFNKIQGDRSWARLGVACFFDKIL